nr:MAG TPA: hypothetical protein [Caudoviricetes sp.]
MCCYTKCSSWSYPYLALSSSFIGSFNEDLNTTLFHS